MAGWATHGHGRRTSGAATWAEGLIVLLVSAAACSDEPGPEKGAALPTPAAPRSARPEVRADLLADLAAVRHASDGGGRAWLESLDGRAIEAVSGTSGSWRVVYEAGELGVAAGGSVFLQVSAWWGWSTPQVERREEEGYTRVSTTAPGVELEPATLDQQLLGVRIAGRALARGERIQFDYGVGPLGARCDDYAEARERFWLAVDGDGDGVRRLIADSPSITVAAGPAAQLSVVAPTVLRPGEAGSLCIALLDQRGNAGARGPACLDFVDAPPSLGLPAELAISSDGGGTMRLEFSPREEGTFRWRALAAMEDGRQLECSVGPLLVSAGARRVLWADLHGHSGESDGTGTPEDYWRYARDVAGLDAAALTDHDHWGMRFLDQRDADWRSFAALARSFDVPESFVALTGYEYTDWIHGHRCVVWFEDEPELFSSLDERYDTPRKLWDALRGRRALTIPHHVAGGPIALDWSIASDVEFEPVVEIVSVHGSSEAPDSPKRIRAPMPGHFARDELVRGSVLGFIGSGDSHDGHPGLSHLGGHAAPSGLAGIVCEDRTREALFDALRSRRVYATSGARILLRFAFAGQPMGSIVSAQELAKSSEIFINVVGTAAIERVDVIHGADVAFSVAGEGQMEVLVSGGLQGVAVGDFVYARVLQEDGQLAWSSPVFVR